MMNVGMGGPRPGAIHDLMHDVRWSGEDIVGRSVTAIANTEPHVDQRDNLFVIAHANSPSFFADLFSVWEVGGCAVCVNARLSPMEMRNVVEFTQPCAVLVDGDTGVDLAVPTFATADEAVPTAASPPRPGSPDDPALILFTSGTSGDPKGVVHTHRSILARIALNQAHIGREDMARSLCTLPTHFGHGLIGNCLTPLLAGCDVFLMHGGGIARAAELGPVIDRHAITFMSSVPGVWKIATRVSAAPTSCALRRVHIGSAPLSSDLWREVVEWSGAREVVNMYGITETANWIAGASSATFDLEDGLLGTMWGGSAVVRGDDGTMQPHGSGEILLRVPSVMSCYYQRPDLTAGVLQNGWFCTGDTGVIDDRGVIRMTGRNRYAINRDGIKIYPEELDLLLERHADVTEACAFGLDDPISGQTVAAAVTLRDDAKATGTQLIEWCA